MTNSTIRIAAIGLGNRACKYLQYIAEYQDIAELVAIIDTDPQQFSKVAEMFGLTTDCCFNSIESLSQSNIEVDACIIGTPDIFHYEMAIKAMRSGWHVLLEKPMGQTLDHCQEILDVSQETGKLVSVCYVLRYHPYFIRLKELTERQEVGSILNIRQTEKVGKDRLCHTFVRGPWNRKEMNTSVFLTKCCHDVDFALWLTGDDILSVRSESGPEMFKENDAPYDADRCLDCSKESECPYSAVDLYLRKKDWVKGFTPIADETEEQTITRMLKESRYGRCVYRCPENDVVEYQTVAYTTASGIMAEIRMECNTEESARITSIECENAFISGDERTIEVRYKDEYLKGKADNIPSFERYDYSWAKDMKLHAGADLLIVKEFIDAIRNGDLHTRTTCLTSLASHKICFMAENTLSLE